MNSKITVSTFFDCTNTGTMSHYKLSRLPMTDLSGQIITDQESWNRSRDQQRNWETIKQCISLRCQPLEITAPTQHILDGKKIWKFEFQTDRDQIFLLDGDELGYLKSDCHGVPMLIGLNESWKESFLMPYFITHGPNANLFFSADLGK